MSNNNTIPTVAQVGGGLGRQVAKGAVPRHSLALQVQLRVRGLVSLGAHSRLACFGYPGLGRVEDVFEGPVRIWASAQTVPANGRWIQMTRRDKIGTRDRHTASDSRTGAGRLKIKRPPQLWLKKGARGRPGDQRPLMQERHN